jgi:hypothetical protein
MYHYYMPYFTRWFLDPKISREVHVNMYSEPSLKSYAYSNLNFHDHTLNIS